MPEQFYRKENLGSWRFWNRLSCTPHLLWIRVSRDDLHLLIFVPPAPVCWDYKHDHLPTLPPGPSLQIVVSGWQSVGLHPFVITHPACQIFIIRFITIAKLWSSSEVNLQLWRNCITGSQHLEGPTTVLKLAARCPRLSHVFTFQVLLLQPS